MLQLVHSNLCGPLKMTPGGHHYFMSFINNHTRYTQVYLITAKTSLTPSFNNYLQAAPTNLLCQFLQSDQGSKYMGCKFQNLLCKHGITHVLMLLHMPELNSVAKQFNHTVLTMVCAYITKSGVKELWGKVLHMAVYVLNCIHETVTVMSPFEHWFHKPATLLHLHVFGCHTFTLNHHNTHSKLSSQARPAIYLTLS